MTRSDVRSPVKSDAGFSKVRNLPGRLPELVKFQGGCGTAPAPP